YAAPGRRAERRAALLLPRARRRPLRAPRPRQRGVSPPARSAAAGRLLRQRRDRAGGRAQLPARLHERLRDLPAARRDLMPPAARRIPVVVVSGFLGSGKTSLVRHLLGAAQRRGERLAVVSNEFGALGIDRA